MADEASSKKRHRSPAYPAMSLPEALERLRSFYSEQRTRSFVALDAGMEALGYKAGSSSGGRAVAALIGYGWLADEGSGSDRKVRLTEAGYRVAVLGEEDDNFAVELREAALRPRIYRELFNHWPDSLPNDSAIRLHLIRDRNFNPEAVKELIRDFRATYAFANLGERTSDTGASDSDAGKVSEVDVVDGDTETEPIRNGIGTKRNVPANLQSDGVKAALGDVSPEFRFHTIPIPGDRQAILQVPVGLSETDFVFLQSYLRLMRGAIVGTPPTVTSENEDE